MALACVQRQARSPDPIKGEALRPARALAARLRQRRRSRTGALSLLETEPARGPPPPAGIHSLPPLSSAGEHHPSIPFASPLYSTPRPSRRPPRAPATLTSRALSAAGQRPEEGDEDLAVLRLRPCDLL
jgi:hypothetical protein